MGSFENPDIQRQLDDRLAIRAAKLLGEQQKLAKLEEKQNAARAHLTRVTAMGKDIAGVALSVIQPDLKLYRRVQKTSPMAGIVTATYKIKGPIVSGWRLEAPTEASGGSYRSETYESPSAGWALTTDGNLYTYNNLYTFANLNRRDARIDTLIDIAKRTDQRRSVADYMVYDLEKLLIDFAERVDEASA